MRVERHESETAGWELARRDPPPELRSCHFRSMEGWRQTRGVATELREVPFPGIPLIFNLGPAWEIDGRGIESFVAGLGTAPSIVRGAATWACIELRLTPHGAHRLLEVPMSELTNRAIELETLVPEARELEERMCDTPGWAARFDLVDAFLLRRLADSARVHPEIEWSWHHLYTTHGRASIGAMATELGWSHRRLISRFREQIGLTPKLLARVIRFDRATTALRAREARGLAEIAFDCGYADQAHLNREFTEFAGTSPSRFCASVQTSGSVAA
jgi:AraC-like DNA-binding protein